MISSFVPELLPPWKAWGIETALLLGTEAMRMGFLAPGRSRPPHRARVAQPGGAGLRRARTASRPGSLFRFARLAGLRIAFWTVNTDAQLASVKGLADIVIADDVDRAVAFFPKTPRTP